MMESTKTKVIKLKQTGYGFVKIAKTSTIPVKEVRIILKAIDEAEVLNGNCKNCNLSITSVKGKKIKQFCSDRCRWDYWNNKQKGERMKRNS